MLINSTLLVQMINFGIAYCLFRFLFFSPLLQMMDKEQKTEKELTTTIETQQTLLSSLHRTHQEQWNSHYLAYNKNLPSINQKPIIVEQQLIFEQQQMLDVDSFTSTMSNTIIRLLKEGF
jgi:hypothetical protein